MLQEAAPGFHTAAPGCLPAAVLAVAQAQDTLPSSGLYLSNSRKCQVFEMEEGIGEEKG